ncbi:OmpA family protein [Pedobacter caeni]|uniref:Outer membrane protein OmpA n=1 Tax=Pedobacter caeni TaxID=288992 RepID=A0A1M5IQY1_9SPHI|nr:OmpA family protein [Pedobacter caeni]SHG30734.1 Outer membrane protein OmpA [Pedobacter caeni]
MNLIEMLKNEVSPGLISSLSQKAGVSEEQVQSGFSAGIPAVLAGILKNGAGGDSGFLGGLLSNITGSGAESNADDLSATNDDSLLEKGKSMLGGLFGKDSDTLTNAISSSSGLSGEKSAGLLAMIVPLVTGFISKIMASKGWSITDLLGKIFESKADISAALPQGLSDSLGIANINMPDLHIPKVEVPDVEVPSVVVPDVEVPKVEVPKVEVPRVAPVNYGPGTEPKSGGGFLKWLIPLLIILIGAWWIMGRSGCNKSSMSSTVDSLSAKADSMGNRIDSAAGAIKTGAAAATTAIAGKLNEAGDFVRDLGASISKKLPDGTSINIGENSVESRLISFLEDKDKPVDKTTWFTFDRLYFETGKSILKAESQEQLKNITAILKAYPNVNLKMGGYTDNTGVAAVNKKISTERANAAVQELVKLGVDAKRLEAEGYGPEHPIASNDTEEGRAQNRRIDIRVTQK